MSGTAAVEAEDELIEIGLKVLAAQAVIDAERPDLEVGEDAVHPRQDDVGRHLADHMGIMMDAGDASITGQSIGACCDAAWRRAAKRSYTSPRRAGAAVAGRRCHWSGWPSDRPPRTKWSAAIWSGA